MGYGKIYLEIKFLINVVYSKLWFDLLVLYFPSELDTLKYSEIKLAFISWFKDFQNSTIHS